MGAQNFNLAPEFHHQWGIFSPEFCILQKIISDKKKISRQPKI